MLRLASIIVVHKLGVPFDVSQSKHAHRVMHVEINEHVILEVKKSIEDGFIREEQCIVWLASIILVRKKY